MKTLKSNIIALIAVPVVISILVAATIHIINLTNAGLIAWSK